MLIEVSDSDAEVSEVDASEIISVSETSMTLLYFLILLMSLLSHAVLVTSEAGVVIESDATVP